MSTRIWATGGLALAILLMGTACASSSAPEDSVVGAWGEPDTQGSPAIEFRGSADAGDYSGSDGCNTIGGSYTATDATIDLGMMRVTRMACEGVDTWLSQASTAQLSGGALAFFDEAGTEIGTLRR